jgi:hypothetical protein
LFLWTAAGIGCRRDDTPQDRNPADFQRYLVESSQFIETEYTVYKFLSDELRPVYVGGNRGTNTGLTWVRAKDHFGDVRGGPEYVKDGDNYFLNNEGVWTVPLWVRAPWGQAGSYSYTFELGDRNFSNYYSTSATIQLIPNRDYAIEYSCMGSSYDLRSTGYQFESTVQGAYATANTRLTLTDFDRNIQPDVFQNISDQALLDWGNNHVSEGINHNPNLVVLFGAKDHTSNSWILGRTAIGPGGTYPMKGFAFVFGLKILNSSEMPNKPLANTHIAIHELGHARGKNENPNPLLDGGIHDGVNKSICVMRQAAVTELEKAFRFCEHDKQLLLNISW